MSAAKEKAVATMIAREEAVNAHIADVTTRILSGWFKSEAVQGMPEPEGMATLLESREDILMALMTLNCDLKEKIGDLTRAAADLVKHCGVTP